MPKSPAAAAPKAKRYETVEEVAARHQEACAAAREKLGRRATAAEVGDAERRAIEKTGRAPKLIDA